MEPRSRNVSEASLHQLIEDLKILVHDSESLLKSGAGEIKNKAMAKMKTTDTTIRQHPYQSMGVVFGLGVLAGVLISGMMGRESEAERIEM